MSIFRVNGWLDMQMHEKIDVMCHWLSHKPDRYQDDWEHLICKLALHGTIMKKLFLNISRRNSWTLSSHIHTNVSHVCCRLFKFEFYHTGYHLVFTRIAPLLQLHIQSLMFKYLYPANTNINRESFIKVYTQKHIGYLVALS